MQCGAGQAETSHDPSLYLSFSSESADDDCHDDGASNDDDDDDDDWIVILPHDQSAVCMRCTRPNHCYQLLPRGNVYITCTYTQCLIKRHPFCFF